MLMHYESHGLTQYTADVHTDSYLKYVFTVKAQMSFKHFLMWEDSVS